MKRHEADEKHFRTRFIGKVWCLVFLIAANICHGKIQIVTTNRPAAELASLLQPHVGVGGHIQAADGFKLIIRADESAMQNILQILGELDRTLAQLKIEVSFDQNRKSAAHEVGITGSNHHSSHSITSTSRGNIKSFSTDSARNSEHSVIVIEGEQAWIQTGLSQPYRSSNIYGSTTEFKEVRQGFYVTPQLTGSNVRLKISTQNNQPTKSDPRTIEVNESETVVVAKLNEWTPITQGNESTSRTHKGWTYSTENRNYRDRDVFVRVSIMKP